MKKSRLEIAYYTGAQDICISGFAERNAGSHGNDISLFYISLSLRSLYRMKEEDFGTVFLFDQDRLDAPTQV